MDEDKERQGERSKITSVRAVYRYCTNLLEQNRYISISHDRTRGVDEQSMANLLHQNHLINTH